MHCATSNGTKRWPLSIRTFSLQEEQITLLLRQRHRIGAEREDDFNVRNLSDIAEAASSTARVMTILLGSVAGISLLVGGIGIMNIMLVSVTERAREIGIRMAVGARSKNIMLQFLVKAVVMAATGGSIGILLGIGSSEVLRQWARWPTLVSPSIVAVAFLFSGAVGVFFGFYPAKKAASLDPRRATLRVTAEKIGPSVMVLFVVLLLLLHN